jgi:mycothiol synthase
MDPGLTESPPDPSEAEALADLINAAYDDWRRLPRVDAKAPESPPRVDGAELVRAGDRGDLEWASSLLLRDRAMPVAAVTLGCEGALARLGWLAVHPGYRRRGLGRRLLDHAIAEARRLGCATLATASYVDSRYEPALRLLESCGMVWADPKECNMTMLRDPAVPPPGDPVLPSGFSLRTWQPGDEPVWTHIKNAVFGDQTPLGWWQRVYGDRPDFDPRGWYLCLHGDRLLGISAAVLPRHPATCELLGCQIDWVGVLPEFHGLGLGRALVSACINYALPFNPAPFVVITQRFRVAAVALYESLGFRHVMDWRTYRMEL